MYDSGWKKFFVVIVGLLEILLFSGTLLGWASLKLMLKNEGIYDYLCKNRTNSQNETYSPLKVMELELSTTTISPILDSIKLMSMNINETFNHSTNNNDNNNDNSALVPHRLEMGKNFTVKINFTISDGQQNSSIIIPFETPNKYNHSFIYQLLNDSSLLLKSNTNDVEVNLINKKPVPSTFENYLNLYLQENFQPTILFNNDDDELDCKDQETTLNTAFGIGSFCMGGAAFIWGFLLQKWGLRTVRLLINGMFAFGAFILCFIARGRDWLLFPGLLIMGLSGVPIRIANMQISNLYPAKRSTIISIYSGAFSASSIIYVLLQTIYDVTGNFFYVNLILVILSLLTIPFSFMLPKDKVREPLQYKIYKEEKEKYRLSKDKVFDKNHNIYQINLEELFNHKKYNQEIIASSEPMNGSPIKLKNYKTISSSPIMNRKTGFINEAYVPDNESEINDNNNNNETNHNIPPSSEKRVESSINNSKNTSPPLRISLTTFAFNLHQIWFSWMITYMVMYIGSLDLWADRAANDPASKSNLVKIYGIIQVLAIVISPIAGLLMDWRLSQINETDKLNKRIKQAQSGFWPLFITTITLLLCVICHYFDSEEFIYASIIFVTIFRSFLLAVGSAFLRIRFHADHFNQLLGIMSSCSAVISLLQMPIYRWEKSSYASVTQVNIFNTVVALLVLSNPLYLLITPLQKYLIKKENDQIEKYTNVS